MVIFREDSYDAVYKKQYGTLKCFEKVSKGGY
jgi:hypothetical protein